YVEIDYEEGNPVAVNGKRLSPAALLAHLNALGGAHGVGRVDLVESRYVGMKSRGVYETPGGTILHVAHHAVESLTLDREVLHLRDAVVPRYAELVYYVYWHTPERERGAAQMSMKRKPEQSKLWAGRFRGKTDPKVETFTSSLAIDHRLFRHDIAGSIAHCRTLERAGVLTRREADKLVPGLKQ